MIRHKKLVSILIMAAMLLTLLPTAGFAEELSGPQSTTQLTGGNDDGNSSADNNSGSNSSTDNNSGSDSSTDSNNDSNSSTDNNSGSNSSTDNNSGNNGSTDSNSSNSSTDGNNGSNSSTDNNSGSNSSTDNNSGSNSSTDNNGSSNGLPGNNNGSNGLPGKNSFIGNNNNDNTKTYSLTVAHHLMHDGSLVNVRFTTTPLAAGEEILPKDFAINEAGWKLVTTASLGQMPSGQKEVRLEYEIADPEDISYTEATSGLATLYRIDNLYAYCYNQHLVGPTKANLPYHRFEDYNGQEDKNEALIRAILLVGYPYDAYGLRAEYGITDDRIAQSATQHILWSVLESSSANFDNEYMQALLKKAQEIVDQPYTPGELYLSTGTNSLNFTEQSDGTFATAPVTLYGYDGNFTLDLPENITLYDATSDTPIGSDAQLTTQQRLVFKSALKPDTTATIAVSYSYHYPKAIKYYKSYSSGAKAAIENSSHNSSADNTYSSVEEYQNLLAFEDALGTSTTTFPITVTETTQPPATTPQPTPTPDPEVPGDGGGDYTPDTPSTPNTTPTETIIPDEAAPLAPAPEVTLIQETVEPEEVIIADDPVPQAPAAPVSDNPKTGHHFNFIWLVQMTLLLSALALLLNDVLKYQHAKQK